MNNTFTNAVDSEQDRCAGLYGPQITAQAIDILYSSLTRIGLIFSLMPITTVWVMWAHVDQATLIAWCLVAYAHIGAGLLLVRAYQRRRPTIALAAQWGHYFTYYSFFTGTIWGSAGLLFFVPSSTALQVFILVVIVVLCVRSIFLHAYWIESYYALLLPTFLLLILGMLWKSEMAYQGLAINFFMGVAILIYEAKIARKAALLSIRLRFENLDLIEQLRAEKGNAEAASRDKTRFLASASHDLRQPVHALLFFMHALRQEALGDKAKGLLDDMGRSIAALNQLLISLLDISKLDADIVKPNLSHFELHSLLDTLHAEYAPQAEAKNLTFQVRAADEVIAYSDPALLETILRNLISNALRYTHRGGITLELSQHDAEVRMAVRDTGIGIASDQYELIFREFYQVTNAERDRNKGLGLGLAIIKRLVALLQHRIELDSQLGQGSCFTIVLPVGNRAAMLAAEEQPSFNAKRDIEGMRVLVIDDEVAVLKGMGAVLSGWGCITILAGSEAEALVKLQDQGAPHAIICDFRLRDGKTGAQAIECLRAKFNSMIPAIIVTGDTDPERLREAQKSGNALIHKPAQPAKLRAFLRSAQRRQA